MDMRRAAFTVTADGSYAARLALDGGTGGWFPERWTLDGPEPYAVPLPGTQPEEPDSDVLPLSDGRVLIRRKVAERHTVSLLYPTGPGTGELQVGAVECERLSLLPPAPGGTAAYGLVHHERSTALWLLHGGAFGPERIAEVGGRCTGGAWLDRTGRLLALDREHDGRTKTVIVDLGRGGEISPLLQITEESQDRLLLADPYSGLLLVRSDAPGHDRLGWGVLGSARPVRFPECLRLPNAVLTPFAAQPGQELAPEGCAVAFRIEGPTGSWVGVWRPAARRLQQFPAPAGWLVGTGLWTAGGELRLPYVTPYVRCGLARLRLPDTDRDRARGEDRDTARAPQGAPAPPPAAGHPRGPNPSPAPPGPSGTPRPSRGEPAPSERGGGTSPLPSRGAPAPPDRARLAGPMPPLGEPAPPAPSAADRARVPNPTPGTPGGPAPTAPSLSDRGPHPAGPAARHVPPDAIRTPGSLGEPAPLRTPGNTPANPSASATRPLTPDPAPLGDPAPGSTPAARHLPPGPTPLGAPAPSNPSPTDPAQAPSPTPPPRTTDPLEQRTSFQAPGNNPADPTASAPRRLPADPMRTPAPLGEPAPVRAPGCHTPPSPTTPAPRNIPPGPSPLGESASLRAPAGPSTSATRPLTPDPMTQLGAPGPGQDRPADAVPAPRTLPPDAGPLERPATADRGQQPDGQPRIVPAEATGPSADRGRVPHTGPARPFASAPLGQPAPVAQGARPGQASPAASVSMSAPDRALGLTPHPANPSAAAPPSAHDQVRIPSREAAGPAPMTPDPVPSGHRPTDATGRPRTPDPEPMRPAVPTARSVLRDLADPSPGPAPARRPLATPDPVRAAACDTAAQGLIPVPVQGPVLGPPAQRVEPEVWTAVPPSVYPGRPAAMPEAWSAAARPAPATRGYECPSRPVPLQQAPLGRNPHP
ncbi:hypothetical protein ACH427_02090 [Streptomyces sp. NPDC020379]|uniref:hypothetical protein n=1 Tax=Streptomyces sp. NPDC020379 TaxID=3365071 RepID=UPI0037A694BD